jgi:hypothetical protein
MRVNTLIAAIGVTLLLAVAASAPPRAALAQSAQQEDTKASQSALAVSPAIIEEVLTPGKPTEFTLYVNNVTNFPLPVKATVRDFIVQSDNLEKTERARLDASRWFIINEPDFILQPKQTRTITGSILPPADAVPGGRYATIYFQPLVPQEVLGPSTAYLSARVGILAFLIVKGDIEQKAAFDKPLQAPGLVQRGPVVFTFSIANSGSVHSMPQGNLIIRDWRGRKVDTLKLPAGIILPGAAKEYGLHWGAGGSLGRYTADLEVSYGSENAKLQKMTVSFWVIPWAGLMGSTIILTLAGLFVRRTRRRWRKAWRVLRGNYYK